ncbi:MAG: gamma-glutamylcyclotransferase [Deltaproteobacteria bacterium]|nr:MAG: gamma-glutamylcyclotransferase [Deltaproteobacteria bacterium]
MSGEAWIFGYGSLVWRPAFAFEERQPAYIEGWSRRFWQGSTDHRGVPDAPGRVVTLVRQPAARCVGLAYRVEPETRERIFADLDARERGGYAQHRERLHRADGGILAAEGLLYVATADNPNYLGPASLDAIASQVRASSGPSGSNVEYVLRLAESLRALDAVDDHVFELERRLRDGRKRGGKRCA